MRDVRVFRVGVGPCVPGERGKWYAYLEHDASGEWPTHAWVVALQGRDTRVDIDPSVCRGVAEEAFWELNRFNASYPHSEQLCPLVGGTWTG
jgi:hypothetical protein